MSRGARCEWSKSKTCVQHQFPSIVWYAALHWLSREQTWSKQGWLEILLLTGETNQRFHQLMVKPAEGGMCNAFLCVSNCNCVTVHARESIMEVRGSWRWNRSRRALQNCSTDAFKNMSDYYHDDHFKNLSDDRHDDHFKNMSDDHHDDHFKNLSDDHYDDHFNCGTLVTKQ